MTNRQSDQAAAELKLSSSDQSFPDGGAYRIEIPSVEGPEALEAVVDAAAQLDVPVHRVSQGSGVMMLTDDEIRRMVALCTSAEIELALFIGPRGGWSVGGRPDVQGLGARTRGDADVTASVYEARRAVELGVSMLLVADEGVLWVLHCLRERGTLPRDLRLKVSALSGPGNSASFCVLERLGADSINIPSELSLRDIAAIRARGLATIDFYVESPDELGGYVRMYDIPELVRVACPIYLKFGLRNAPGIYPTGLHLRSLVVDGARERVRRARLGLDLLARFRAGTPVSPPGARELPRPPRFAADADGEAGFTLPGPSTCEAYVSRGA